MEFDGIQAFSSDMYEFTLDLRADYRVTEPGLFSRVDASAGHLLRALVAEVAQRFCAPHNSADLVQGVRHLTAAAPVAALLHAFHADYGLQVRRLGVLKLDVVRNLSELRLAEVSAAPDAHQRWEREVRVCEQVKKCADVLDRDPVALQLRILKAMEDQNQKHCNFIVPLNPLQSLDYPATSFAGNFNNNLSRQSSHRYQHIYNNASAACADGVPLHERLRRPFPRNPSAIGEECGGPPRERDKSLLLRPVFINAVEVGYAYGEAVGRKGVLCMRGCVIALWYFLLRGHDTKLFFPHCYRRYAEKTDDYNLLGALQRIGVVQFTQGYGQEKYNELSRVLAANARRFGGCIVACSSLRKVFEENHIYRRIVQKRVLVPCFVGDEVLFPADGPEGRSGLPYSRTIVCKVTDEDYDAVLGMQMKLEYQVRVLTDLMPLVTDRDALLPVVGQLSELLRRRTANRSRFSACQPPSYHSPNDSFMDFAPTPNFGLHPDTEEPSGWLRNDDPFDNPRFQF